MHRSWEQLKAGTALVPAIHDVAELAEIVSQISTYFDDADPETQPERAVVSVFLNELEETLRAIAGDSV